MNEILVLQVGDVHFDDLRDAQGDIDVKDQGIAKAIQDLIGSHPLHAVMKPLTEQMDLADAVMIAGDLSSYGKLDVYIEAVQYLDTALALEGRSVESLHAVVGNHDVDRALVVPGDRTQAQIMAKFDPLAAAWNDHSVPILAASAVRRSQIVVGDVGLEMFSLNSCIGCGEYRHRVVDAAFEEELEKRAAAGDKAARDTLFEQLDSPMFVDEHLAEVTAALRATSPKRVPIILAHHNVLPQFQPRLQIYTEMVNAGVARARLAACDRPVLYLHGHIHDDPIEVIEQYRPHHGRLIAVSAPQVEHGFNVLRVSFNQRGLPLGVTVVPWRRQFGEVRPETPVRISLRRPDQETHEMMADVLTLMARRGQLRYSNFVEEYHKKHDAYDEAELQDALREADWAGLLILDNPDDDPSQWTLRRPLL